MKNYDVIVIGGGPAGLVTAREVSNRGISTLIIEKKPEIGIRPLRCGEAFGPKGDWPAEIPFDHSWVEKEIGAVIVEGPTGKQYKLVRPDLGWVVNRSSLEKYLAKRAEETGASIKLSAYAQHARFNDGRWEVSVRCGAEDTLYTCRVLVGADGLESRVGSWTGIKRKFTQNQLCVTAQIHFPVKDYEKDSLYFFLGPRFVPYGYAWIFPGINGVHNIGLGSIRNREYSRYTPDLLKSFLKEKDIPLPENPKFVIGGIPVEGLNRNPVGNQSLLVGDTAGMAYPLSGGGILNALSGSIYAGKCIGDFFHDRKPLKRYSKIVNEAFYKFFRREMWARKLIFSCNDEEIAGLLEKTKRAVPKGLSKTSEALAVLKLLQSGIPLVVKKFLKGALYSGVLVLALIGSAQAAPAEESIACLRQAIGLGERQEYDSSFASFDSCGKATQDPLIAIFRMNVLGLQMLDYGSEDRFEEFERSLLAVHSRLDSSYSDCNDSGWHHYRRGTALVTLSAQYLSMGRYMKGVKTGLKSIGNFRESIKHDPVIHDCYLYLGLYDYAFSEIKKRLWWILFWKRAAGKEEGIRKLKMCREKSHFSSVAASQVLLGVYTREKKYLLADEEYSRILTRIPNDRPARWTFGNAYFEEEEWAKALVYFQELVPLVAKAPGMTVSQRLLCQYRLAYCYYKQGLYDQSEAECRTALSLNREKDKRTGDIKKDINNLLEDIASRREK